MIRLWESVAERWFAWAAAASWQLALLVAVVAAITWVARRSSPRVRYALWLLVLIKVFLPPSLSMGWSVGSWGLTPLWNSIQPAIGPIWDQDHETVAKALPPRQGTHVPATDFEVVGKTIVAPARAGFTPLLFLAWLVGCCAFYSLVLLRYQKLQRSLNQMQLVDEGPLRVQLEAIALELGESRLPELYLSDEAASPYLFGVARPSIVLPKRIADELSAADLNSVLRHELNHWQRRDPWVGWLQVLAQGLFWFHPFVWLANARLRHERECVCDEAVLRAGKCEPVRYGEALLAVLAAARGRSSVQGSLVGVFEPGANIQSRLEEIMSYEPEKRQFGVSSYVFLATFACLFLPMALPTAIAKTEAAPKIADTELKQEVRTWPWIVKTVPAVGATDVDSSLKEITVTFDRDMQTGMSWTGSEEFYMPPSPNGARAEWRDSRTCVLPVTLKKGQFYRVGINSTSFQNFKSDKGISAPSAVIYFTTQGATKSMQSRVRVPKIVKILPANGANDVAVDSKAMRVTFDMPMGGGMSWTGGGSSFPASDGKVTWNGSKKTCVFPVALKPSQQYQLGLNSVSHINFQSKWGVPIVPVTYSFGTAAVK